MPGNRLSFQSLYSYQEETNIVYSYFKSIHFFAAELTGSDKDPNIDVIENNYSEFNPLVHFCEEMRR